MDTIGTYYYYYFYYMKLFQITKIIFVLFYLKHEAVRKGYLDIVNTLIKYGAFVNVPGFEYESPLHTAIKYDHIDIAVILLKHGADANHINLFGDNAQ